MTFAALSAPRASIPKPAKCFGREPTLSATCFSPGAGSSPTLYKNLLFPVNFVAVIFNHVVALDKETGRTVWRGSIATLITATSSPTENRALNGDFRKAFSTPAHRSTLTARTCSSASAPRPSYAYGPITGKEFWRVSQGQGKFLGQRARPIFRRPEHDLLRSWATAEAEPQPSAPAAQRRRVTNSAIASRLHKKIPTRSSLLVLDGSIYMVTDAGIVNCVDAKTGAKKFWHGRIDGTNTRHRPHLADGRIHFFQRARKDDRVAAGQASSKCSGRFNRPLMASMATPRDRGRSILHPDQDRSVYRIQKNLTKSSC